MSDTGNIGRQASDPFSRELVTLCESDLLSEDGLRELFERHGLTSENNNNTLVSDYGFFFEACNNEKVSEGIIRCLLEYFPDAVRATDGGFSPLHAACFNKSTIRGVIELLIDAAPDSLRSVDNHGHMPLHSLCMSKSMNETALVEIAELLIEKYSEAVRHKTNAGNLPIHIATQKKSPQFCQVLIEAYPGSERIISDDEGWLPLHFACYYHNVATIEFLCKLCPDTINHATALGLYPIHLAIAGLRSNSEGAIETVQYLLDCDSDVIFQKWQRIMSLLHFACRVGYNDANIDAALDIVKTIYDAHPEEIEVERITLNIQRWHQQVQAFINSEMVYARQAKDRSLMNTPDDNGQLPLHTALQNNVRLGSIKLLVKGNPSAIRSIDDSGALPSHIACQHHESASVVGYMISLANITLDTIHRQGNTTLHYACRGAKYDTISLLLEKYDAVSVSKRNAQKKLPIDLLWESNAVEDRDSVEYIESVFRLLKAYPETVMNVCTEVQSASDAYLVQSHSGNGKKR